MQALQHLLSADSGIKTSRPVREHHKRFSNGVPKSTSPSERAWSRLAVATVVQRLSLCSFILVDSGGSFIFLKVLVSRGHLKKHQHFGENYAAKRYSYFRPIVLPTVFENLSTFG